MTYCKPNLPENTVSLCAVGDKTVSERLNELGIETVIINKNDYLEEKISNHADMNILYLGSGKYVGYEKLLPDDFSFIKEEKPSDSVYPKSVKLNGCVLGDKIIGNPDYLTVKIDGFTVIPTKQGYGKCSCLPISASGIITGDPGIAKILRKTEFDILLIDQKQIKLCGYDNGFIGGCGGLISKDILLINGNIKSLNDCDSIMNFCRNHNVYIECMNSGDVTDFGGFIQLKEKSNK